MKVAIVAESFLPNINGVTNSVLRVLEYLREQGHEAIVIAPGARDFEEEIGDYLGFPITRVPTIMVPLIDSLPIGVPRPVVTQAIREFAPDVVHLASPFVLGGAGAFAARMLQIPTVAVYQTDVAGFASRYRLSPLAAASWEWTKTLHNMCTRTLAPSSAAIADLHEHGIERVYHWGRGVDAALFHPDKRSERLRREWSPRQVPIVGFVGRLAAEKGVHRLGVLAESDVQLVIIGDGPERPALEEQLPGGDFYGRPRRGGTSDGLRQPRYIRTSRRTRDLLPGGAGGVGLRRSGDRAAGGRAHRPDPFRRERLFAPPGAFRTRVARQGGPGDGGYAGSSAGGRVR